MLPVSSWRKKRVYSHTGRTASTKTRDCACGTPPRPPSRRAGGRDGGRGGVPQAQSLVFVDAVLPVWEYTLFFRQLDTGSMGRVLNVTHHLAGQCFGFHGIVG